MKKLIITLLMFSFFTRVTASNMGSAYDYSFNGIDGGLIELKNIKIKLL